jgi:palmitoyltransferase ZDHHC9/14/18
MAFYALSACLAQIIVYMNQEGLTFGESMNRWRVPFALVIYALLAFPYPLALMMYHLFLMARGETTREYLNSHKFIKSERHRAFTQENIIKNWIIVLCRPRPPTYMHFKRKYEEGDQRFGERRGKKAVSVIKEADEVGPGMEMQKLGNDPMAPGSSGGRRVV